MKGVVVKLFRFVLFLFQSILTLLGTLVYSKNDQKERKLAKEANQTFTKLFPYYVLGILAFFAWITISFYRAHFALLNNKSRIEDKRISSSGNLLFENASLLIAIVSAVILVLTFVFQLRESKKQNFRTNFFEYLKIHRENTREIETRGKKGHDAFIEIYKELKFVYDKFPANTKAAVFRLEWSYIIVFYGLGITSTQITKAILKKHYKSLEIEIDQTLVYFEQIQLRFNKERSRIKNQFIAPILHIFHKPEFDGITLACILDGHQSDLGHYYRHLYQTITFVNEFSSLWEFEKYDYVKNVRAQFSNHEIAVFLANAYSPLGKKYWIDSQLIEKYQLVKNLPSSLFPWKNLNSDFPKIKFDKAKA